MRRLIFTAIIAIMGSSVAVAQSEGGKPQFGTWGVDLSSMEKSVRPGDNFFDYVNGEWLKTAKIPADRSSTGAFPDLGILSEKRMKEIAAALDAKPYADLSLDEKKLRDLYDAFEDTDQIESRGLKPVKADLALIAGLKSHADVARVMGTARLQTGGIFGTSINVDDKNPDAYAVNLGQSGLGMPDRDYYLRDDKALAATREAYKKYLVSMLSLAGVSDAERRAAAIFDLETRIAKAQWTRADRRDRDKTYNPMPYSALRKLAPDFPWNTYFKERGITRESPKGERSVIVAEKSAFPALAKIFADTPVAVWRDYLTVRYLGRFASYLPKRIDDADFAFYGTVLGGQPQQLDRPTRGVHLLDGVLGEALGKIYVAKYFPPEAKAKADALVANLLKAYEADIKTLDWMSEATKAKALEKIHEFTPKIGYPDHWRDYSALRIARDDLIGNVQRAAVFDWNRWLARLDKPVDKSEWFMTPPTVNAYYDSSLNQIVFPAAILQPPFFDPNADDAVNYGGIGAVIGHEISHGFDDQGSKYTGKGVFENWWTKQDRANFDARTAALVKQVDSYEALPGLHLIGENTLGENIADLAGLAITIKAYRLSLGGKPAPVIDGYTGIQRLFLSFGQIWRIKMRENALRRQVLSNPHSPPEFRVISATRNSDAWYDAFGAKPGDTYYLPPDKRIRLW